MNKKKYRKCRLLCKMVIVVTIVLTVAGCGKKKTDTPVRVAVIDTGISTEAILQKNIAEGKNYVNTEQSTEDTYGHGTAVASIILSDAPDTQLVPLVSSVYEDGKIKQVENDTLAEMIRDAVDIYGCRIINLSAGLILDKESVRQAVEYAEEKDVLIIASAGNDYMENGAVRYYPAAYESVLAVGALNADGTEIATFSQRGEWVDAYAVGEKVKIKTLSGNTHTSDGTSYSAAKVTAEVVHLMEEKPNLSVKEVREQIKDKNTGRDKTGK